MDRVETLKEKYYSDVSKDGTLIFYNWLRQYIKSDFIVLNIGAGSTAERKVKTLRGEVKQVIGIDIDEVVLKNEDLDQAFVLENDNFPFRDNYFDLAWADFVMEHIKNPMKLLQEVNRVLKPGASFFFRTPNKHHYVSLIGMVTPQWFHERVANPIRRLSQDSHIPFPTFYRFNSKKQVVKCAHHLGFSNVELQFIEAEPSYLVFHPAAFVAGVVYERVVNRYSSLSFIRANIFGRLQK